MAKKLWNIFHVYDTDGGFGDAITQTELVGTVEATDEEIAEFVKKWNNPQVYDSPYADLYFGGVFVDEVKIENLATLIPYDAKCFLHYQDDYVIKEEE